MCNTSERNHFTDGVALNAGCSQREETEHQWLKNGTVQLIEDENAASLAVRCQH